MKDFKTMGETMAKAFIDSCVASKSIIAYCDYIADSLRRGLVAQSKLGMQAEQDKIICGEIRSNLHSDGYLLTTQKTIIAQYKNKSYKITVEEHHE